MAKLPRAADPRKVLAALARFGWQVRSTKGGHVHLVNRRRPGVLLTVPFHPGRGVSPGALRALLRLAGISVDDFVREL